MKINTKVPNHLLLSLSDTAENTELAHNDKRHLMSQWVLPLSFASHIWKKIILTIRIMD